MAKSKMAGVITTCRRSTRRAEEYLLQGLSIEWGCFGLGAADEDGDFGRVERADLL